MKIGFVVAADRFTGAAAVAELTCRAVRAAGVDGRLLFRGGRNLEHRLTGLDWARPGLVKERRPADLGRNLRAVRRLASTVDVVVCHLPHDHGLCAVAGICRSTTLVRSLRHPKHLRPTRWWRWLMHRTAGVVWAHSEISTSASSMSVPTRVVAVPVEDRFHHGVTAGRWRERLRIPEDAPVLGIVGKVAAGRGFDVAVETVRSAGDRPHLIAVGHGDLLAHAQRSAADAGVGDRIHWLGYRDNDLPELYAATDVVLFMGAGSDHGHRAITEAQACARPVVAANVAGVGDLIEDGVTGRIVDPTPQAFAGAVTALLADRDRLGAVGRAAAAAVEERRMVAVGNRLLEFLNELRRTPRSQATPAR